MCIQREDGRCTCRRCSASSCGGRSGVCAPHLERVAARPNTNRSPPCRGDRARRGPRSIRPCTPAEKRGRREPIAQKNQCHHQRLFPARAGRAYNAPVPPSDASGHANPARRGRCRGWERSQALHFRGEIRASLAEEATCLCGTQADHIRHPERVEVRVERASFRAEKHRTGRRRVPYIFNLRGSLQRPVRPLAAKGRRETERDQATGRNRRREGEAVCNDGVAGQGRE